MIISSSDWLWRVVVPCVGLVAALLASSPTVAQPIAAPDRLPSLVEACREGSSQRSLWLLNAASLSHSHTPVERTTFNTTRRAAYRLFERHYVPYRDPQMASSWTKKPYALVQPSLQIDVVRDSVFQRWENAGYPLDASWNAPPVVRQVTVDDFRPRIAASEMTVLYARPEVRSDVLGLLLPSGLQRASETRRRVACLEPVLGLTDWVRTSNDAHSPPEMTITMNVSRTRAIAGYGWGSKGGVWVLYRRPSPNADWTEVRPIGAWTFQQ